MTNKMWRKLVSDLDKIEWIYGNSYCLNVSNPPEPNAKVYYDREQDAIVHEFDLPLIDCIIKHEGEQYKHVKSTIKKSDLYGFRWKKGNT